MVQAHSRMQKMAPNHLCVVHSFGFVSYRSQQQPGSFENDIFASHPTVADCRRLPASRVICNLPTLKIKDLRRVLAALKRCNRVRGITFLGTGRDFNKFFNATKDPFPALSSLDLRNQFTGILALTFPATFLKGSAPHLRYLTLHVISLTSVSQLLSSATALIELSLGINVFFDVLPASLLAHLQGTRCLGRLELRTQGFLPRSINHPMPPTKPGDIVLLPKLTCFHYQGDSSFLGALVAGFATPSLRDVHIEPIGDLKLFILHCPQFIDNVEKLYHSAQVVIEGTISASPY